MAPLRLLAPAAGVADPEKGESHEERGEDDGRDITAAEGAVNMRPANQPDIPTIRFTIPIKAIDKKDWNTSVPFWRIAADFTHK